MPEAKSFHLPDLVALCESKFELRTNRHCRQATLDAQGWAKNFLTSDQQELVASLQLGLLASLCFPTCDLAQLVVVTKFFTLLLIWKSDSIDSHPQCFDTLWESLVRGTTSEWQGRFRKDLDEFREARPQVDTLRKDASNPDIDSFLTIRRPSSGADMALDLIEYAEDLRIPNDVSSDPILSQLKRYTRDIIIWANDIAAYNIKQSLGDSNNLVAVLMADKGLSVQPAIHAARKYLQEAIEGYLEVEKTLPAWGESIDDDVRMLVQGYRDWIIGSLHWVYEADRYFQGHGDDIRSFGWVFLMPESEES